MVPRNKLTKPSKATFEPSSNKRRRIAIDEPGDLVINRMRTRSQSIKNRNDRPTKKDDKNITKETKTTVTSTSSKRRLGAIEEFKRFPVVALKRLTAEELKKHGIDLTAKQMTKETKNTVTLTSSNRMAGVIEAQLNRLTAEELRKHEVGLTAKANDGPAPASNQRIKNSEDLVGGRMRTRNGHNKESNHPIMEGDKQMTKETKTTVKSISNKRKRVAIEDAKNEQISAPTSHSHTKVKRQGRRSMKMQLQERILNDVPGKEYLMNEIVLATIPGYSPWPARITNITGQTIMIEFFGTGQM